MWKGNLFPKAALKKLVWDSEDRAAYLERLRAQLIEWGVPEGEIPANRNERDLIFEIAEWAGIHSERLQSLDITQMLAALKHSERVRRYRCVPDSPPDDSTPMSTDDLAKYFEVTYNAAETRLRRWRKDHLSHEGIIENSRRGSRDPKYFYKFGAVKHLFLTGE